MEASPRCGSNTEAYDCRRVISKFKIRRIFPSNNDWRRRRIVAPLRLSYLWVMSEQKDISGKIPPQDIDAERSVLGALMIDPIASNDVFGKLKHRRIFTVHRTRKSTKLSLGWLRKTSQSTRSQWPLAWKQKASLRVSAVARISPS